MRAYMRVCMIGKGHGANLLCDLEYTHDCISGAGASPAGLTFLLGEYST